MICACGKPRFWNSMTLIIYTKRPKHVRRICNNCWRQILNARATTTGTSEAFWPGCSLAVISGHSGLHIIVKKYDGFPKARARARLSAVCSKTHLRDPKKLAGSSMLTDESSMSAWISCALDTRLLRIYASLSSSILEYISQRYSEQRCPNIMNHWLVSIRPLYHSHWVKPRVFDKWFWWESLVVVSPQPRVPWGKSRGYWRGS